jgi:hypothetical protein
MNVEQASKVFLGGNFRNGGLGRGVRGSVRVKGEVEILQEKKTLIAG